MPAQILPRTAAAFGPRAAPTIVLGAPIDPWLTATLRRSTKIKRPLNNVSQHSRCLADTLGRPGAIWTLTSLLLPSLHDDSVQRDPSCHHEMLHLQAYVVHVDTVSQNEIAFKLNAETIAALIAYHKDTYCPNVSTFTPQWHDKHLHVRDLHKNFINAVNRYIFRTDIHALEGLEEDGAGELLGGRANHVKQAVMNLFLPLEQPVPEPVSPVVIAAAAAAAAGPLLVSNGQCAPLAENQWWQTSPTLGHAASQASMSPEPWRAMPHTPSPTPPEYNILGSQHNLDVLPYEWQQSASADQAQASPTPSLSRSIYSQGEQGLFSSPYTAPAAPYSPYNMSPTSHCDFSGADAGTLTSSGSPREYMHDYSMLYSPQYAAVSMSF